MPNRETPSPHPSNAYLLAFVLFLLAAFISAANVATAGNTPKIRIAILPCTDIVKTFNNAQPLRTYLEQQTHRQLEIVVPNTLEEFKRTIQLGEAEFAFQAPHTYLQLSDKYDTDNLLKALTPQGKSQYHGVIVTRWDSGIKKIVDLRGRNMIFGHPFSTAKWLAPKALLEKKGIDLTKDLKNYTHGDSCESIAMNIYLGQGDAGALCDYSFDEIAENSAPKDDEIPPDALVIIGTTREIPTWVFTARTGVDAHTIALVNNALLKLDRRRPEHRAIMEELDLGGFIRASDHDFDSLRNQLSQTGSPHQ